MMQTVTRKRVEILADAPLLPRLIAALGAAEIAGHTVFSATSGSGRTGQWSNDGLTGTAKMMLVAIASAEHAATLVEELVPMLDSHRLLLTISDVEIVRGDRF